MGEKKETTVKLTKPISSYLWKSLKKSQVHWDMNLDALRANRLAIYLEQKTGIKLSGEQVRRIQKPKKVRLPLGRGFAGQSTLSGNSASKYSLEDKQDQSKREAFKEKLQGYLTASIASPEKLQVWFWAQSRRAE